MNKNIHTSTFKLFPHFPHIQNPLNSETTYRLPPTPQVQLPEPRPWVVNVLGKAVVKSLCGVQAGVTLAKVRKQCKDEASLRVGSLCQESKGQQAKQETQQIKRNTRSAFKPGRLP